MLYELGYVSGLETGSVATSDPVAILGDGLIDISTNRGQLIIDGTPSGISAQVSQGALVSIEATSGGQPNVPVFAQLTQNGALEGTFVLINAPETEFSYNDALNGLYAWEVLPESTFVASDNGSVGVFDPTDGSVTYTPIADTPIDTSDPLLLRNRVHVLDYYLNHINVYSLSGDFLGRVTPPFEGPIDSTTVYNPDTDSRIVTVVAYERSNKVVLFDSGYNAIAEYDHTEPVGVATLDNRLHIVSRNSNDVRIIEFDSTGLEVSDTTVTLARQPHRIYQIDGFIAVLTLTSIEIINPAGTVEASIALPANASSMAFNPDNGKLYITHRQDRKITEVEPNIGGSPTIRTEDKPSTGYMDAIAFDRVSGNMYVVDVVLNTLYSLHPDSLTVSTVAQLDTHSYEIYVTLTEGKVILNSLYPDIDTRLIISDSDPDPQEYFNVTEIPIGGSRFSPEYTLTGIRNPATLYLYPDDDPLVNAQIDVGGSVFSNGAVINPDQPFRFEVSILGGRAREINFVLGQSIYRFGASPDTQRRIPEFHIYEPVEYANAGATVTSNTIRISGLDVQPASISTDGIAVIYKNGVIQGNSTSIVNGDNIYLSMPAGPDNCDTVVSQITYAGLFTTSWAVTTGTFGQEQTLNQPTFEEPDFIDIEGADLDTEYTSEPVIITLPAGVASVEARITTDYLAEIIVNGSNQGNTATLVDGDSVQLRLTTENILGIDHQITLSLCKLSLTWVVTTLPAVNIIPLDFGVIEGVTHGDRVESEELVLDTVSPRFFTSVSIPAGVIPIVDGVPFPLPGRELTYKGVLRYPTTISVRGESAIKLEGYSFGRYGTLAIFDVRAGLSRGSWSIRSVETTDGLEGKNGAVELIEGRQSDYTQDAVTQVTKDTFGYCDEEIRIVDGQTADALHEIQLHVQDNYEGVNVITDHPLYLLEGDPAIYNKVSSKPIEAIPATFIKNVSSRRVLDSEIRVGIHNSPHTPIIDQDQRVLTKETVRSSNIVDINRVFRPNVQNRRVVVTPTWVFYQSSATTPLVDTQKTFIQNVQHHILITEREHDFYKSDLRTHGVDTKAYKRISGLKTAGFDTEYVAHNGIHGYEQEVSYHVSLRNNNKRHDIEYGKWDGFADVDFNIPYSIFANKLIVDFHIPYRRYVLASLANIIPVWVKVQFTTEPTWSWSEPLVHTNVEHGLKILDNTVNSDVDKEHSIKLQDTVYNLTIEFSSDVLVQKPETEYSYWHHHEISTLVPQFVPMDTFTYTVINMSPVTITEDECATLGNENCLDVGYFATPQEARTDAEVNWGVAPEDVGVFEVAPGCWAWSQDLPCVNSCHECPATGYIQGG